MSTETDISRSLTRGFEAMLDATLAPIEASDEIHIVPARWFREICLREKWREVYRAARVLAKRELAFEFFGDRRVF